jgi:hypothetical protein
MQFGVMGGTWDLAWIQIPVLSLNWVWSFRLVFNFCEPEFIYKMGLIIIIFWVRLRDNLYKVIHSATVDI